ncbi:acyltransferase family protein [Thermomonas sp.]|uniref:acyltransferase family protein n=1 Tax=Thermomonas sp. TaxID=1971895 RepID=UPI00248A1CA6|nr:acyltransferase family protein [Thermomonas sp.]MDI1253504.1 acyltransferase family protein [Thermomonas sp.]
MAELDYRRHIDGLRALAVLAVVAYHAGVPWVQGGFVGVDVFFVISGFLITGLLFREFSTTGDISLVGFYERRVRRLAPALLLVLAATLALGSVFLVPVGGEQQGLAKSAIATVLLVSNFYFANATGGYFDAPAAAQPLLHTWSLSVEEQFYLVWPGLMLLLGRWSHRRGIGFDRPLGGLLVLVFVVSLALSIITTASHREFAFFGSPTRAWEFAAGGLVYVFATKRKKPILFAELIAGAGLLAILYSVVAFDAEAIPFPGWHATIPTLGTAALIMGCEYSRHGLVARLLSVRPLVAIGLVSYAFYLWHWPLLVMARLYTLGEIGTVGIAGVCLLALVLAALTYRFVENPIRRKQVALMATRSRTFRVGAVGCAFVVVLAAGLGAWAKLGWTQAGGDAALQTALADVRNVHVSCEHERPYKGGLLQRSDCDLPKGGRAPDIIIWGDSHAAHYVPALTEYARRRGLSLRIRYMPECPPLQGYSPTLIGIPRAVGCERFNQDVLQEVQRLSAHKPLTVVLASHWPAYTSNSAAFAAARSGAVATLRGIASGGARAVVVAPTPDFHHEVPACLARRPLATCSITRRDAEQGRSVALAMLASEVAHSPTATLFDPFISLCTTTSCPATKEGAVMYSDSHHLTVAGSLRLVNGFAGALGDSAAHGQGVK